MPRRVNGLNDTVIERVNGLNDTVLWSSLGKRLWTVGPGKETGVEQDEDGSVTGRRGSGSVRRSGLLVIFTRPRVGQLPTPPAHVSTPVQPLEVHPFLTLDRRSVEELYRLGSGPIGRTCRPHS